MGPPPPRPISAPPDGDTGPRWNVEDGAPTRPMDGHGASAVVWRASDGPYITHATVGKIIDKGIKDANNRAAMASTAYDTLSTHFFPDTGSPPTI